jgi:glycosyltransferase involved in cell wall biosynthesis
MIRTASLAGQRALRLDASPCMRHGERIAPSMTTITIVAPFLNEAANADRFGAMASGLAGLLSDRFGLAVDFLLVDDGSTDDSVEAFRAAMHDPYRIIALSRNFGKEVAVLAGLDAAGGELVLVMDTDLQHTSDVAMELVTALIADPKLDCAYAVRTMRSKQDGWHRSAGSHSFYRLINFRQRYHLPPDAGDFRAMRRNVVDALVQLRDKRRFNKGLYAWAGFRSLGIPYVPAERPAGHSAWSRIALLGYSLDAFTSFSVLPLRMLSVTGVLVALAGMIYGGKVVLEVLFTGISVPGYPSLMVAISVLGGINLALLGMLGEYVWVALSEAKDRPIYLIREIIQSTTEPSAIADAVDDGKELPGRER